MPKITPFKAYRPAPGKASHIAALPYDVYNREEALAEIRKEPMSFLRIDRAETNFDSSVDTYADCVYEKAAQLIKEGIENGDFIQDDKPCYYIYELTMEGRAQTGIVACSDIHDYQNGIIKKHENTREDKEIDRIRHVDTTNMHTGPIFLAYRATHALDTLVAKIKEGATLYDFTSPDGITHRVWKCDDETMVADIGANLSALPCTYIADGHHRCASAVKVGLGRAKECQNPTGDEEFNRFLSVLFPDNQLAILPYNRVVKDLKGMSKDEFIEKIKTAGFDVELVGKEPLSPSKKATFGMYLDNNWYKLSAKENLITNDPVKGLDVSILQDNLLAPILGIGDPRTDKRIDFVGGIRGLGELERRCHTDCVVAFSMYPTSIEELFCVADAGLLMPPKSTWFEPKLRSGLFMHSLV